MKRVRFENNCKSEDGVLFSGSSRMWLPAHSGLRLKPVLEGLWQCFRFVPLPLKVLNKLEKFLGRPEQTNLMIDIRADRQTFDQLLADFLNITRVPIPTALHNTIIAARHSLSGAISSAVSGQATVVCLFPVSACRQRWVEDRSYQYDGGWRTDGLWLWLGQKRRSSHEEVLKILENACGAAQAVLVFSRRRQSGTPHVFVGRAQGYLPVAAQDPSLQQPYRAALMMDTTTPFEIVHGGRCFRMCPGWQTSAGNYNKDTVHAELGLQPPQKFKRWGWSISVVHGSCNLVPRPIDVVHSQA